MTIDKPLRVGQRVYNGHRRGKVTHRIDHGVRFTYMVRWDGNQHESGEYGIRDLHVRIGRSVRT